MPSHDPNMVPPVEPAPMGHNGPQTAWPGAHALADRLLRESTRAKAWRPVRAGAIWATAEAPDGWMTLEEFRGWLDRETLYRRRTRGEKPLDLIGMSPKRRQKILRGEAVPTKVEALACAHAASGLQLPVQAGDVEGFAAWVARAFGFVDALADWLELNPLIITDRMRGFDIVKGERVPRAPEIGLIRAMAWVDARGPFCPYGGPVKIQAIFPGQS